MQLHEVGGVNKGFGGRGKSESSKKGTTVKQVLVNPVYAGANVYGRHKKGDTRVKPCWEWTVVPGKREPLVAPEIFERVQAGSPQTGCGVGKDGKVR